MPQQRSKNKRQTRIALLLWTLLGTVLLLTAGVVFLIDRAVAPAKQPTVDIGTSAKNDQHGVSPTPEVDESITFTIAGDMMFDRAIDSNFRGDKIFDVVSSIKDEFKDSDVAMVNLEGPISATDIPVDNTANNMSFNFPPKTADVLASLGVDAVSLANNHTNNDGRSGLENTRKVLLENNIKPIGSETDFDDSSIGRFQRADVKLSVITINSLEVNKDITAEIKQEKDSGAYVLIFPHWGTEYEQTHASSQERLAHAWIDAGADLVVGSHPHVIEDMVVYKGKPIFYSLGNLLFDQTFSKETQRGLILKGVFEKKGLTIEIWPTVSEQLRPEVSRRAEGSAVLDNLIKGYERYQLGNYPRNTLFFGFNNEN